MRILVADDHEAVRKGVCAILSSRSDVEVCGEAENGKETIEKANALKTLDPAITHQEELALARRLMTPYVEKAMATGTDVQRVQALRTLAEVDRPASILGEANATFAANVSLYYTNEVRPLTGAFVIPHDKCTLASYLGMEPESLSRNLASLAEAGVSVRGRQISVSDSAALARIARITDTPLAPE